MDNQDVTENVHILISAMRAMDEQSKQNAFHQDCCCEGCQYISKWNLLTNKERRKAWNAMRSRLKVQDIA